MNFLKSIFAKYTGWVKGILLPLGAWGVFGIAFVDAAIPVIPIDSVVATYVYQNPDRWWLYALMASIGSALGSVMVWAIGFKGGEPFLEKKIGKRKIEELRNRYARLEFFFLMIPAMLPPPFPFKALVLAAGVFEMKLLYFISSIFIGRMVRFSILSFLTIRFGPQVVGMTTTLLKDHWPIVLAVVAGMAIIGLLIYRARKQKVVEISV